MNKNKQARVWFPWMLAGLVLTGCDNSEPAVQQPIVRNPPRTEAPAPGFNLEQALQVRVAERPGDIGPKVQLANLYYDHKQFARAIPMYLEALELDPANPSLRTDLGTCYVALERFDEARASFEQVMAENPTHVQSVFNLGVVEKAEGDLLAAAGLWDRAAALSKDPQEAKLVSDMAARARQEASAGSSDG